MQPKVIKYGKLNQNKPRMKRIEKNHLLNILFTILYLIIVILN